VNVLGPSAATASAAPDWSSQLADLLCPLCDYNLRGLTEPRCPECGYSFEWDQLRDERLKTHPYLFEHHPERNVWSFRRTATGGLLPGRFWKRLHPSQPSRPGRLVRYWAVAMAVAFVAGVVGPTLVAGVLNNAFYLDTLTTRPIAFSNRGPVYASPSGRWTTTPPPPDPGYFDLHGFRIALDDVTLPHAAWWVVAAAWPWLTMGALFIFRISMSRAKLRPGHVRRCVLYSFDAVMWAGIAALAISGLAFALWLAGNRPGMLSGVTAWCLPVLWLVVTYRLGCAYRDYLRFAHPFGTVVLSQVMVALATVIAIGSVGAALDPR
jgi:hypothetical protein